MFVHTRNAFVQFGTPELSTLQLIHGELCEMQPVTRKSVKERSTSRISYDLRQDCQRTMLAVEVGCACARNYIVLQLVMDQSTRREIDVSRAERRVFNLPGKSASGEQWQMVVDTSTDYGRKLVVLRSVLEVQMCACCA
jgi:hypothetical protein